MTLEGNIAVLGAGAIGGSIAAYLAKDGYEITVIDQWSDHIETIRRDGLKLTDVKEPFSVGVRALHLSDLGAMNEQFDVVFLSVKSYDTRWAATFIEPYVKATGFVLPAQNGMNDEPVAQIVGFNRTVGCVPTISSAIYDPGHVIRTDPVSGQGFHIGELTGAVSPRATAVAEALSVIGPSDATSNIWGSRWSKLATNCMGNAMAGLIGPHPENLSASQQELAGLIQTAIACEVVRVGTAHGFTVEPILGPMSEISIEDMVAAESRAGVEQIKSRVDQAPPRQGLTLEQLEMLGVPGRASLLQDVIKGRRTEVNYLNGYVVDKGAAVSIATPANAGVVDVMTRVETGELEPSPDNVDLLEAHLPV